MGLKRSTVANHLRLLELPDSVQDAVGRGWLTMGHARAILGLPDEATREEMMAVVIRDDLSVRETEKRIRARSQTEGAAAASSAKETAKVAPEPWIKDVETRLRESLGTKVRLHNGANVRGQIVIDYYDQAGLESLLTRFAPKKTL